ncbi:arginine deiminase-related protein [Sphingobacterium sp. lm-10]|uniref:citrulline utilization hydrolase CtlX n=1 Tax=Sphingobacterium sp. lm-10 TaxID=2944904 RepID=UPI002020E2BC|nr:arginine deiminase-related protein [Sphingobacterium sp. lm-10]MCL7988391.1 arginine deiminase-related protein [Sphingobacterium sp. lm-10]
MRQTTDTILMVRPSQFRKNEDTAVNNFFQTGEDTANNTQELALAEFNTMAQLLESKDVQVIVVEDSGQFDTPDSIFPNNVISFHGTKAVLYPMYAENRRLERNLNVLGALQKAGFSYDQIIDYSIYEDQHQYLESTGVLILDRINATVYCSLSPRANPILVQRFCEDLHYQAVVFEAFQQVDGDSLPIYHTNVMMSLGTTFAVICIDSITDEAQRKVVQQALKDSGREIITISEEQMNHFCGNILELRTKTDGDPLIVMSEQAYKHFTDEQKKKLATHGELVQTPLYTIEKYGGGSARCMIAEIFHT